MRRVFAWMLLVCITGCNGTVVLQSQSQPPRPQPVPGSKTLYCDISQRQAAEIVAAEADARHCDDLDVQSVKRDGKRWKVELTGECGCREARIRAKVDRRTGEIESYKVKLGNDNCRGH